ncbi:DUF3238 domain-containing protein [Paenibacillus sp. Soil787]|uniref:DUF3238 domain-containing protein n=1 Tax=Paenibacillus sp. Soil787 TaxID=1736411 RepID=UPI0006FD9CB3|nr:DUF3238 domain-containing protein [Paenibacillus sp. Soil787]KRF39832.1 hypothetical protein ASG93_23000 [Paenibacillus sp. Soil787]
MANIVEVRVAAFIDNDWIFFSSNSSFHYYFEGNNRGFTYYTENQPSLFKMAQHAVVNFSSKTVQVYNAVGPTRQKSVNFVTGETTYQAGQTDTSKMNSNWSFNSAGTEASIWMRGASSNPQVNLSPDIDWDYNIKVKQNGEVSVQGYHDGYPNHEIYKRVDSGTPIEIYRFNKQTVLSLAAPMEHSMNITN